jgi:hypothetical protein
LPRQARIKEVTHRATFPSLITAARKLMTKARQHDNIITKARQSIIIKHESFSRQKHDSQSATIVTGR